jgi:TRAP-type C4-dicarboxylate transport system permease small subunit
MQGSERRMEGKARFVFPVVITAFIVFVVSGAVTFFNIGWRNDFMIRWWSAFVIGWPIAASTAYLAIPFARNLTQHIVAAIERRS